MPITLRAAKAFIGLHHRHNGPPHAWRFGAGLHRDGQLVGVAVAGRPLAQALDDGMTLEVLRTCTDGTRNANSMLYGAVARAAKALGYARLITYTLPEESGASLRAAGWEIEDDNCGGGDWSRPNIGRYRHQTDLFGEERRPPGRKIRWVKQLQASAREAS